VRAHRGVPIIVNLRRARRESVRASATKGNTPILRRPAASAKSKSSAARQTYVVANAIVGRPAAVARARCQPRVVARPRQQRQPRQQAGKGSRTRHSTSSCTDSSAAWAAWARDFLGRSCCRPTYTARGADTGCAVQQSRRRDAFRNSKARPARWAAERGWQWAGSVGGKASERPGAWWVWPWARQ